MHSHAERGNEGNKYARKNQSWTIIIVPMVIVFEKPKNCRKKFNLICQYFFGQFFVIGFAI
jgi:hypothetical protein